MKPRMNACDDVNYHDTRYVVSNIDQTVTVPDHVDYSLLSVSAGGVRIDLPDAPAHEDKT